MTALPPGAIMSFVHVDRCEHDYMDKCSPRAGEEVRGMAEEKKGPKKPRKPKKPAGGDK